MYLKRWDKKWAADDNDVSSSTVCRLLTLCCTVRVIKAKLTFAECGSSKECGWQLSATNEHQSRECHCTVE